MFSLFSVYLGDSLKLSNAQVGIIVSILSIASIFMQPFWGIASDITKKTKRILLLAIMVSIITSIVFLFITSFTALFINFLIMSLFYSAIIPLSDTMTLNFVNKYHTSSFSTIRAFGSIGYAIGALLIGFITQYYGIRWIFIIFSFFMLITLFFTLNLQDSVSSKKTHYKKDFKSLLKIPNYWILVLFVFIFIGTLYGSGTYLNLYIKHRYGSLWIIGVIYFLMAGIEMPVMLSYNRLIKKLNPWTVMLICSLLSALRLFGLSLDSSLIVFIIICITQSIILGLTFPNLLHIIHQLVPSGILSTSVTLYTAIGFNLSRLFLGIFAGYLSDTYGYQQMFQFYSIVSVLAIIISGYLIVANRKVKV